MRDKRTCPSETVFSRAFTTGDDSEIKEHLSQCEACAETWAKMKRMISMVNGLPVDRPTPDRAETLRNAVLNSASGTQATSTRRVSVIWLRVALAASVVIAIAGYLVWRAPEEAQKPPDTPVRRATIHPQTGAEYLLVGAQPDEIVRLSQGTITVTVEPLKPGERFRVVTGDGEVSVKGTVFDVTATADRLTSVQVFSGKVEVRSAKQRVALLGPRDQWSAPDEPPAERERPEDSSEALLEEVREVPPNPTGSTGQENAPPTGRASAPGVSRNRVHPPKEMPSRTDAQKHETSPPLMDASIPNGDSPVEKAFNRGWNALRRGDAAEAIAAFDKALTLEEDSPLAQDALYWQAIAYSRKKDRANAIRTFSAFVERFPAAPRRGEASVILGWHYFDAGDFEAARRLFRSALNDVASSVRKSAQQGIDAVEAQQRDTALPAPRR